MNLQLKILIQVENTGEFIWVTDKTGKYVAFTNPTGYGGPNISLGKSALLVVGKRLDLFHSLASTQILYDSTLPNDRAQTWKLNYLNDGWNRFWMVRLWVTNNGIVDVSGGQVFSPGDLFYIPAQPGKVWMKTGSGASAFIQITDYDELLDTSDTANIQVFQEILMYNKIAKKKNDIYKQMIASRDPMDSDQTEQLQDQIDDIDDRIQAAQWAFDDSLQYQANDFIDDLITDYQIT